MPIENTHGFLKLSEDDFAMMPGSVGYGESPQPAPPGQGQPQPQTAPPPTPAQDPAGYARASEAAGAEASRLVQSARGHFTEAAQCAQRVEQRKTSTEAQWAEGGVSPSDVTKFITEQETDTRAASHFLTEAQRKMDAARQVAGESEGLAIWGAIKSRYPNINETDPRLTQLATDLYALRRASGFIRPYTELLDGHLAAMRIAIGQAPVSVPGAAPTLTSPVDPYADFSPEDRAIFGLPQAGEIDRKSAMTPEEAKIFGLS